MKENLQSLVYNHIDLVQCFQSRRLKSAKVINEITHIHQGPSWSCSYGSWIYNYLYNQCLSALTLRVRTPFMVRCTRYNIMWSSLICQWFAAGLWFSPGTPVSSTNKADRHDITEILLKVALNTINITATAENHMTICQVS